MSRLSPIHGGTLIAVAILAVFAEPSPAQTQSRAAITQLDPSIESSGMAGATVAAFWSDQPNVWVNPSLAAFQRGIRWSYGTTQLMPSQDDDILKSHQIFVGAYGIGVEASGKPLESLGKIRLDYGDFSDLDANEPFRPYERSGP